MTTTTNTISKIQQVNEIMQAFTFLRIRKSRFAELKAKFGGLDGLYAEIGNRMSGKK